MSELSSVVTTITKRVPRQVYFVTGTDTDVGKTTVTAALLQRASQHGWRCFGVKPVSAGCQQDAAGIWQSADALELAASASVALHPDLCAPIRLPLPVSPHLAAQAAGVNLSVARLAGLVRGALSTPATHVLIEGAGGWDVPINSRETLADLAKTLQFPVILGRWDQCDKLSQRCQTIHCSRPANTGRLSSAGACSSRVKCVPSNWAS